MSGKLGGKIALVTGGTAGIGLATAQRFVKEGAYVFVTGRRQTELDLAAKLMSGHATAVKADASNLDDLDELFAQIKREKGRLDVVYANAGGGSFAPIGGITEALRSNLRYQCERYVVHGSEGSAPGAGWRVDHHDGLHSGLHGYGGLQCLLCSQSGNTVLCPVLDAGFKGPEDPRQRGQSRTYRNSRPRGFGAE
jgi:hypothetical protein